MAQDEQDHPSIETTRKAISLVRLLLAHQHSGSLLKREDITKHIDVAPRAFPSIMDMANDMLKDTFGMQVKELTKVVRNKTTKAGQFVLVSTITPDLRGAFPHEESNAHILLNIILSLIYVHQRSLLHSSLMKLLRNFHIDDSEHEQFGKIDVWITRWIKEGYLVKGKIEDGDYLLGWGARAEEELGEDGVESLVLSVFDVDEADALISNKIKQDLKRLSHAV